MLRSATTIHAEETRLARKIGNPSEVQSNISSRPAFAIVIPNPKNSAGSQPPPMLPTADVVYDDQRQSDMALAQVISRIKNFRQPIQR
jgi:hypothetical protein